MRVGKLIRGVRADLGMSQQQLADHVGALRGRVAHVEANRLSMGTAEFLEWLSTMGIEFSDEKKAPPPACPACAYPLVEETTESGAPTGLYFFCTRCQWPGVEDPKQKEARLSWTCRS